MNKHKKLFAVLTLVCFLFTLMPISAFADGNDFTAPEITSVTMENAGCTATAGDKLFFEIEIRDEASDVNTIVFYIKNHEVGVYSNHEVTGDFLSYNKETGIAKFELIITEEMSDGLWVAEQIRANDTYGNLKIVNAGNDDIGFEECYFTVVGCNSDFTAPEITSITMENAGCTVKTGDKLFFEISVKDESGVGNSVLYISQYGANDRKLDTVCGEFLFYDEETGTAKYELTITETMRNGSWMAEEIRVCDNYGNLKIADKDSADIGFGNCYFYINERTTDFTYPTVQSITMLNKEKIVSVGDTVYFDIIAYDEAGLKEVKLRIYNEENSEWFESIVTEGEQCSGSKYSNYHFGIPVTNSMLQGQWRVAGIIATDNYGNQTRVDAYNSDIGFLDCVYRIPKIYTGACGKQLSWTINDCTKTLTISGIGEMYDSKIPSDFWHEYEELIKYVVIEDGVTSIGDFAFSSCQNITDVVIAPTVQSIGKGVFAYCDKLEKIVVPEGTQIISEGAFGYCEGLQYVSIPSTVMHIGDIPFDNSKNMKNIIVSENNKKYDVQNGLLLEKIEKGYRLITCVSTDSSCSVPEGVIEIANWAFQDNDTITSIVIPKTVNKIGSQVFPMSCILTDVYFDGDRELWETISINFHNNALQSATIHYKDTNTGSTSSGGGSYYIPPTTNSDDITVNNTNSNIIVETSDVKVSVITNAQNIAAKDSSIEIIGDAECAVSVSAEDKQGNALEGFFTPVTVEIPIDSDVLKTVDNISHLTLAKVVTDENGNTSLVYMGGNYNTQTGVFTAYADEAGDYVLVEDADVKKIELQIGNNTASVNGADKTSDVAPRIIDNHTYVPLRYIAEILGCNVAWDEATRTVTIKQDGITMKLVIDEKIEGYNVSAVIRENRTLVPFRYIAEQLGANVIWHPETQEIVVVK